MIQYPELIIVCAGFGIAAFYLYIIHRILSAAEKSGR
jgi:hypothetical protein